MAKIKADTLLRKIQKGSGSLNTGQPKQGGFTFNATGGISVFKKREIVRPYLHPIDSRLINEQVKESVQRDIKDQKFDENYDKFLPSHLVNDLYSLYYNKSDRLSFESLDKTNRIKFEILDSINNSLIKIVTNNSHIGSYVYAEEVGKYLYKKFMELPPEQQKQLQNSLNNCNQPGGGSGKNSGQGGGNGPKDPNQNKKPKPQPSNQGGDPGDEEGEGSEPPEEDQDDFVNNDTQGDEESQRNGDNSSRGAANNADGNSERHDTQEAADQMAEDIANSIDKMLNTKQAKKDLDKAFEEAEKKIDKLKDLGVDVENAEDLPEEESKEIIKNLNNLDHIRSQLQRLNTSKDKVLKAVQKILNGTTNYFSKKCITNDVELFEADQLLDINGIEFLHPIFRKSRIFDLDITERKYIGKFDLYVDCSGSMSAGCGGDLSSVPRIDLAKSLAMQMKELGILGDLYEFEGSPKKIMNTDMSILMMDARGGTDIEKVLRNIVKTGNNSVVLSDGESNISTYTHKAFFIGVGTDFHYFRAYAGPGQKLIEEGQCVVYNGKDFVTATMQDKSSRGW